MRSVLILAVLLSPLPSMAAGLHFASGDRQTVMIELYTSEGCSSCPPAEAYLNDYRNNPDLWKRYVPLAFHVDYWDDLGWKDRFSRREYSERQRRYAAVQHMHTVFTPAFFANGRLWRPDSGGKPAASTRAVGNLAVMLDGNNVTATFEPEGSNPGPLALHLAVLGMNLSTRIRAGENAGRRLDHEFVVLAQNRVAGERYRWHGVLPQVDATAAPRYAFVAWLSRSDDPAPLQAVGGYLPSPPRF